jgi:archaellum component FlaC
MKYMRFGFFASGDRENNISQEERLRQNTQLLEKRYTDLQKKEKAISNHLKTAKGRTLEYSEQGLENVSAEKAQLAKEVFREKASLLPLLREKKETLAREGRDTKKIDGEIQEIVDICMARLKDIESQIARFAAEHPEDFREGLMNYQPIVTVDVLNREKKMESLRQEKLLFFRALGIDN